MFPVVPASQFKPCWLKEDAPDVKNHLTHYMRCPSVQKSLKDGFIVYNALDIVFERNSNGEISWWADKLPRNIDYPQHVVECHSEHFIRDKNSVFSGQVIKITTGWKCMVSDDTRILFSNIFSPDHLDFIACTGTHEPYLSPDLTFQGFILKNQNKFTLKAGTPLLQILPLTSKKFDYEVRLANEVDLKYLERFRYLLQYKVDKNLRAKALKKCYVEWQKDSGFNKKWNLLRRYLKR